MRRIAMGTTLKHIALHKRVVRWSRVVGILVIVGVLVITLLTGLKTERPSKAARQPIDVSMNMHPLWTTVFTPAEQKTYIDKLAEAKMKWIRIDVGWINIFPNGPTPTGTGAIATVDNVVNYANSKGLKVLMIWYYTPPWANGNQANTVCPNNVADYANSAKWAAANWKGRVQAFEVWNEEDSSSFWQCSQAKYLDMLKAAYPKFHEGNPDVKVVIGGPIYNNDTWLKYIYDNGGKNSFDVMATHPYPSPSNETPELADTSIWRYSHVKSVVNMMKQYQDENKEFWLTEYGFSTHADFSTNNWERGVTEAQQADYSIRAIQYAHDNFPTVTNIFFYDIRDRVSARTPHEANFGMFRTDGSAKPFYTQLKTFLSTYYPAALQGDVNKDGRVNALDMSVLIAHDGQNYPAADFNGDGKVGSADMAILIGKWTW